MLLDTCPHLKMTLPKGYTMLFEKGRQKNVHATIPKVNMGYDQYAVPDTAAVKSYVVVFR